MCGRSVLSPGRRARRRARATTFTSERALRSAGAAQHAVGANAHEVGDVVRVRVDVVQRARIEVEKGGAPGQPTLAEAGHHG